MGHLLVNNKRVGLKVQINVLFGQKNRSDFDLPEPKVDLKLVSIFTVYFEVPI